MNVWEFRLAVASAVFAIAGMLTVGIPAFSHMGMVPETAWRVGVGLGAIAVVLFVTSVAISIVGAVHRRHE